MYRVLVVASLITIFVGTGSAQVDIAKLLFVDSRGVDVIGVSIREFQPNIPWNGRINSIAVNPASAEVIVAADSGGLFRSRDGGANWVHLDAFLSPLPGDIVYTRGALLVTARDDFKTPARVGGGSGGIWKSSDGGDTWRQTATLPLNEGDACVTGSAHPGAFGLTVEPSTGRIFVATSCGLLWSETGDAGSWTAILGPTRGTAWPMPDFYDVEHLSRGRLVAGGASGIWYSQDGGMSWLSEQTGVGGLTDYDKQHALNRAPAGGVYLATNSGAFYSANGGRTWKLLSNLPVGDLGCGGWPLVRAVAEPSSRDLPGDEDRRLPSELRVYYGNKCKLYSTRIRPVSSDAYGVEGLSWTEIRTPHPDVRALALKTGTSSLTWIATDGGLARPPRDGTGSWEAVGAGSNGLNALQIMDVAGQRIDHPPHTDLYFGTQDNFLWASPDGGETWPGQDGAEGLGFGLTPRVAHESDSRITYTTCVPCVNKMSRPQFVGADLFPNLEGSSDGPFYVGYGKRIQWSFSPSGTRVFVTPNLGRTWNPIANFPEALFRIAHAGGSETATTIYLAYRAPLDAARNIPVRLMRLEGIGGTGAVIRYYARMDGFVSMGFNPTMWNWFVVFGVDPRDPLHLIAPDVHDRKMKESFNGGDTWTEMPALTRLVTKSGALRFTRGPSTRGFEPETYWPIVTAISFNPDNPNFIAVGTHEAGVFFSVDRGRTWRAVPDSEGAKAISSFHWQSLTTLIVASYGRGLWKVNFDIRVPLSRLDLVCGARCRRLRVSGPVVLNHSPSSEQTKNDKSVRQSAFVVMNGQIGDINLTKGSLTSVTVTPGSTVLTLANESIKPWFKVVESTKSGKFAGLESWTKSLPQKNVIVGLTFKGQTIDEVLVSDSPVTLEPTPSTIDQPKPSTQNVGLQTSPIEGKPYIYVLGPSVLTSTEPIGIAGRGFRADPKLPIEVLIDGQVVKQGLKVSPTGTFVDELRVDLRIGAHTILVRQTIGTQQILQDGAFFFIGSRDGMDEGNVKGPNARISGDEKEEKAAARKEESGIAASVREIPKLLTATDLIGAITVSGGKIQLANMASAKSPDAKSLDWIGVSPGDQLTVKLELTSQASVGLYASFLGGPEAGSLRVLVNGKELGEQMKLTIPQVLPVKQQLAKVDFRQGTNTITFIVMPSQSNMPIRLSLLEVSLEK